MKNFGEKNKRENEFVLFSWEDGKKKLLCEIQAFSTRTYENFSLK